MTILALARSKRSRGNKRQNSRSYDIRAYLDSREELFQFDSNSYEDVELKSKDQFAISMVDEVPTILQNFNVNKYWRLNDSQDIAIAGWIVFGLVFAAILLIAAST